MRCYGFSRLFENGNRDVSLNAWEVVKKLIEWLTVLQVVKKILDRYARSRKDGRATLDFGIDRDEGFAHLPIIRRRTPVVANETR